MVASNIKRLSRMEMEGDRKELLKSMCNLSQGIKEQGIEQGRREERISTLVTFFKNDGSYWICGEGIGTKQKTVSGEADYTVTCSSEFVP